MTMKKSTQWTDILDISRKKVQIMAIPIIKDKNHLQATFYSAEFVFLEGKWFMFK